MKIIMLFLTLCFVSTGFAHPPRDVEVSYSQAEKMLTVNFVHVSNNRRKNYIKKIEIIRSNGKLQESYYVRQDQTKNVFKQIPIELKTNEIIKVKLYCKKGGISEVSYVVPEDDN